MSGILIWLITFIGCIVHIDGEIFTASINMETLYPLEELFITNLKSYINAQETKIAFLRKELNNFEKNHIVARTNPANFLQNPINAFLLIKRLFSDWDEMEKQLAVNASSNILLNITTHTENHYLRPNETDLNGATIALVKLQDTYQLNTNDIAKGIIKDKQFNYEFSTDEYFLMGNQSFYYDLHNNSISWFSETLKRMENDTQSEKGNMVKYDILGSMALSYYYQENYESAINTTKKLLELFPDDEEALTNLEVFQEDLKNYLKEKQKRKLLSELTQDDTNPSLYDDYQKYHYGQLCRNDQKITSSKKAPLACKYVTNKSLFLKIAPLKLEELFYDPYVIVYHDVLYESEINHLKELSGKEIRQAMQNKTDLRTQISKSAILQENEDDILKRINRRIEDMTEFTVDKADPFQVTNYGIGGYHEPHIDFLLQEDARKNHLSTVMFYMSNVTDGGKTVFPLIDMSFVPKKGSAIFWLNLYITGDGDYRTKHGECPIFSGSKWVARKWIQIAGQELQHPCEHEDFE